MRATLHPALSPLQLTASEEEFLRTYAGVVSTQLSQLPQHSIDQGESRVEGPRGQRQQAVVPLESVAPALPDGWSVREVSGLQLPHPQS